MLRIRIRFFSIPDPNFFNPGSRIRIKEFKYFNPKKWFLSSWKYDPGFSSRITGLWIRIHFFRIRIRIQWIRMEANTDPDTDPDPIRIQGFNDQKLKKIYS